MSRTGTEGSICCGRLLDIVDTCLVDDLGAFKSMVQDVVDELEEMRCQCRVSSHKALVTRLLFIITRCSRLVLTGACPLVSVGAPTTSMDLLMPAAPSALQRTSRVTRAIPCMRRSRGAGSP